MAPQIIGLPAEQLHHTPLPPSWQGKLTNTEARELVSSLLAWSAQFQHPQAVTLTAALADVEKLFIRVWTEIDETLTCLHLMAADPTRPSEHLQLALKYLNRWQDRGGRVGNGVYLS